MATFFDGFQECKIAGSKQGSLLEYWPCSRRRPYNKCAYCLANTRIRIEHHHSSIKPDVRTKEMKNQQTDSRGGSRGRVQGCATPPEMTCGFLIQLVFCQKIYIPGFFFKTGLAKIRAHSTTCQLKTIRLHPFLHKSLTRKQQQQQKKRRNQPCDLITGLWVGL